jgi:hypothetical protein
LILDGPSKQEAALVIRKLAGQKALILIDNFSNDIDAYNTFCEQPNITIVVADRDYFLSGIRHLLRDRKRVVIDITGLSRVDLQGCRRSIPELIRSQKLIVPQVTGRALPSLYEFVEANTVGPTIEERMTSALRDLKLTNSNLAEMLVFAAYVHASRTPISMDMALAYWQDRISNYREIYHMMDGVGSMLAEYEGDLAKEAQDYFAARSAIVSEAVLNVVDGGLLRKMILNFHKNISPYRICNFGAFQKKAYRWKLYAKAFDSWEEGSEFYDHLYEKTPNPYIRQHQALFLNARKRFSESFQAIDAALAETGGRNFTIRNSHAKILFRANIDLASSPEARVQLDKSMNILMQCYDSDRRKAFHAMTFADFAMRYWEVFRDDTALKYITLAKKWLHEQEKSEGYLRRINRLRREVERIPT